MSARPWPENAAPTPEQFADWYVTAPRDERVTVAERILSHEGAVERAWDQGWSARARYDERRDVPLNWPDLNPFRQESRLPPGAACAEYDHAAIVTRTAGGPRWDEQPAKCHVATEVLADEEAAAFIRSAYVLTDGCRPDVMHADLRDQATQ